MDYVVFDKQKLKKGYTTGTCAAAAAKACVKLLKGESFEHVSVDTAEGKLNIPVKKLRIENEIAHCTVIKYAGDDPDVTDGAEICAEVILNDTGKIEVTAGVGIGIVTLSGLKIEVGKPAINPVPMKMIKYEVSKVLEHGKGASIKISVPNGENIAKKTFNPKLGIVGGISILGTTGIVTPMSEEAYRESLLIPMNMLHKNGIDRAVFIFGEYGKDFLSTLKISKKICITVSNFIGYMLDNAEMLDFKNILIIGHIGKLIKVSAGIFQTHSKIADCRMEILAAYAGIVGADTSTIKKIYECVTTNAAVEIVDKNNLNQIYNITVNNVKSKAESRVNMNIEAMMFGDNNRLLAITDGVNDFIKSTKTDEQSI